MGARIPQETIDAILARTDLKELIEPSVKLKRSGGEGYFGLCPFHNERTPSFRVNVRAQFYHCFGCGKHGTALTWLMEFDNFEFREAVAELAQRAGIDVPELRGEADPHLADYELLEEVARRFGSAYEGSPAQAYCLDRKLSDEWAQRYGFGFGGRGLLKGLDARRLKALHVQQWMVDRLIIPIRNGDGRVCGFSARSLDGSEPKYSNTAETPIFQKRQILWGLQQARQFVKTGPMLLVEGYMDALSLVMEGIAAGAVMGTAPSEDHVRLAFRGRSEVIACFDGDNAGRNATVRSFGPLFKSMRAGRSARVLSLPEGFDPDKFVREGHSARLRAMIDEAAPLSAFAEHHFFAGTETLEQKAVALDAFREVALLAPPGAFRDLLAARIQALGSTLPTTTKAPERRANWKRSYTVLPPEEQCVYLLVQEPQLYRVMEGELYGKADGIVLLQQLLELCATHDLKAPAALLQAMVESPLYPRLTEIAVAAAALPTDLVTEAERAWRALQHQMLEAMAADPELMEQAVRENAERARRVRAAAPKPAKASAR